MAKSKGLGRGLDALFGPEAGEEGQVQGIRVSEIVPNPNQPRRVFDEEALAELAESIRQNGVITPLTVRRTADGYQIIAGERRWRACRMAGVTTVPAVVMEADEERAFKLALVENLQREDLNPIEEAEGYQTLISRLGLTQEQAAEQVGRSRSAVANAMRLLALPQHTRDLVSQGKLSAGHGRALLPLEDPLLIQQTAGAIMEKSLSVRETEALVKRLLSGKGEEKKGQNMETIYIRQLERDMASSTGHKVRISHGKKKGKLTIEYYGNADLDRICEALRKIEN